MPSKEYWPSDSVQPGVGSVVDVLDHVHGKPAYFRGTVRRVRNAGQVSTITIAFERQTHYGLTFRAELLRECDVDRPSPTVSLACRLSSSSGYICCVRIWWLCLPPFTCHSRD